MKILIPQGIGDSIWALTKVQDLAKKDKIEIAIACVDKSHPLEARALEFVKRFDFVDNAYMYAMPLKSGQFGAILLHGHPTDEEGYYRYIPSGVNNYPDIDYCLMPNEPLEHGIRLEEWLPEIKTNWDIMSHFRFKEEELELANCIKRKSPYAVFFMGSVDSNGLSGHNRGAIWKPEDWIRLGKEIEKRFGLKIVVVGATYDLDYYVDKVGVQKTWMNMIGTTDIGLTYAMIKNAQFTISYQSGIGIVSSYLGVPTGIFWRERGDSISPHIHVSFDERMASAWASPKMIEEGKHLPLIYGRHNVDYILEKISKWNIT